MLRTILKWTGIVAAGLAGLAILLAIAGMSYEAIAAAGDAKRYPPPGRMVDIGGRRMHILCMGTGGPTVVLEAGLGGTVFDWITVQSKIARFIRVCATDRAGMGWSDPGPMPRTPRAIANDLAALLIAAKIDGPYILVGHSLGGKNVRVFALLHPHDVAGMVLVDARNELMDFRTPKAEAQKQLEQLRAVLDKDRLFRLFGIARLIGPSTIPNVPPETARTMIDIAVREPAFAATTSEADSRAADDLALRDAKLGALPLVVLASGQNMKALADWRAGQARQAALSGNARFTVVPGAGHYIQRDRPDVVIAAVREVVEKVRQTGQNHAAPSP